jgi:hypothetical protein
MPTRQRRGFVLVLLLTAALMACGRSSAPAQKSETVKATSTFRAPGPAPRARTADDLANFLAGIPGDPGGPLAELESEPAWKTYRSEMDSSWNRIASEWLPPMSAFQKTELADLPGASSVVFYPFSGPDSLAITIFFPSSPVYVMVGLEPAGTLPESKQITKEKLESHLAAVRNSVSSVFQRSFFITREMDKEFRGEVTDGLFTPILLLLARSNHTVLGYRYVRLDENGQIIEREANYKAPGRFGNKGLEIDFQTDADQSMHKLIYLSVNLADDRLAENQPFLKFLDGLQGTTTFFKATSYMTHHKDFSKIRDQVLAKSAAVLQDDSGIPYRYFDAANWKVQLYGNYEKPYGSFAWLEQPDLRKAYATLPIKPLNFRIGYGFSRVPSNLLLARHIDK